MRKQDSIVMRGDKVPPYLGTRHARKRKLENITPFTGSLDNLSFDVFVNSLWLFFLVQGQVPSLAHTSLPYPSQHQKVQYRPLASNLASSVLNRALASFLMIPSSCRTYKWSSLLSAPPPPPLLFSRVWKCIPVRIHLSRAP